MKNLPKMLCLAACASFYLTACISQQQITMQGSQQGMQTVVGQNPATMSRPSAQGMQSSGPLSRHVVVQAGDTVTLATTFSVKPDCTFQTYNEIRIKEKPAHGTVSVQHEKDYPHFAATNARAACNGIKLPGTMAEYTPEDGFTGVDFAVLQIVLSDGKVIEARISITVK